jgi:methylenetetrahydrofolate--tRNA-(uracil-5-)-methyltransferase
MSADTSEITVVGGGLAGCEAAWQILKRGLRVTLYEQRPHRKSPAHTSNDLAELVCSNSLRSDHLTSAVGLLKAEMRLLDSLVISAADACRVPAGQALAVDRSCFSRTIEKHLRSQAGFNIVREEVVRIPRNRPAIIATGPLTSESLAENLAELIGAEYLHFYDAIAPIVETDSVDMEHAFWASRYGKGDDDYLNCPLDRDEYLAFIDALLKADQYPTHEFEDDLHFEGCLPIEEMAARGEDVLRFGPMKPVGLEDPRTGHRPYAVLQLRRDDLASEHLNLVGFQTKMRKADQKRVIRMIPALAKARFARMGQMHRNSYINSPKVLTAGYKVREMPGLFIAGQLAGVEGYVESAASGLCAGIYVSQLLADGSITPLPPDTAMGALGYYIANADQKQFQPMNITFGLIQLGETKFRGSRRDRRLAQSQYALDNLLAWREKNSVTGDQ